jgi:hypothetical protein
MNRLGWKCAVPLASEREISALFVATMTGGDATLILSTLAWGRSAKLRIISNEWKGKKVLNLTEYHNLHQQQNNHWYGDALFSQHYLSNSGAVQVCWQNSLVMQSWIGKCESGILYFCC